MNTLYAYLVQCYDITSKDYGRRMWLMANDDLKAKALCRDYDFHCTDATRHFNPNMLYMTRDERLQLFADCNK